MRVVELVLGISGLSTACFLVMSISTGQENLVYFCSILLGVCIGIYFFNAFPAKLFLGDSGAQTLGFILASVAIVFRPDSGSQSSTWFAPVLLFYVPLFDLILVVVSRIRRKKRNMNTKTKNSNKRNNNRRRRRNKTRKKKKEKKEKNNNNTNNNKNDKKQYNQ